jgi:hypothetical protein
MAWHLIKHRDNFTFTFGFYKNLAFLEYLKRCYAQDFSLIAFPTTDAVFSAWSVQCGYKEEFN